MSAAVGYAAGDTAWHENNNPLATADQLAAEKLAVEIVGSGALKQARADLKTQWMKSAAAVAPVSAESLTYLEQALDETVFAQTLSSINTDAHYPKIISTLAGAHTWFGVAVPGYRTLLDNPDTIYRTVPLDPAASYVITGAMSAHPPVDANFSVWDGRNKTLANLTQEQLIVDASGNFTIDISAAEFSGKGNHLPLAPTATKLFVRNTINDWGVQQFLSLQVARVSGPQIPPAKSVEQLTAQAAQAVREVAPVFDYYTKLSYAQPVNTLPPVSLGGSAGRLATQVATYSAFNIADDEALIVTLNTGGAKYFIAPVYTRWMTTTQFVGRTQTLNNRQALANPDGTYTLVISVTDPKIYNWIDTAGLHEGLFNLRWQALPATPADALPAATMQHVKLSDLPKVLPVGTRYVTPAQREAQRAERVKSYTPRYMP
ncbi:MAG: hypothetical protein ABW049_08795 [Spongiibacteraceae bacterium]